MMKEFIDRLIVGTLTVRNAFVGVIDLNGNTDGIKFDADGDSKIYATQDDLITVDINGASDFAFSANSFAALSGSVIQTNTIDEATALSGVTIDGVLIKDGRSNSGRQVQELAATGAITIKSGLVELAHATVVIAATLAAPTAGDDLIITNTSASGTTAHTVKLPSGVTWNGTNNTATFDAPGETLHVVATSATRWLVITNVGTVGFSTT